MGHSALDEVSKDGAFVRTAAVHRNTIDENGPHPPEAGRYHLYVALACPWACGVLTALYLKGLEDVISVSIVHPTWRRTRPDDDKDTHAGWWFRTPGDPPVPNDLGHGANEVDDTCIPDIVNGCKTVREVYELAKDQGGKYSTPILFDKVTKTIVSNESLDILPVLNSKFNAFAKYPEMDLFPAETQPLAEDLNSWIYPNINDGVYRSGFARTQGAYEDAVTRLFEHLERADEILSKQRYLTGDKFTWIDLRLFHTLVRFDPVYHTYFKCNVKRIADFKHLPNFVRDVYQMEPVKRSINMRHIKMHYYTSHPVLNTYGVIPASNGFDLDAEHGREKLGPQ